MITIIDYGLGNLRSVEGAVRKLGYSPVVSNNSEVLTKSTKLILPGVGAFNDGMKNLNNLGLIEILTNIVVEKKIPILGICLGFQLMANESTEFGLHQGLGWLNATVDRIKTKEELRVPHIGWNDLYQCKEHPILKDIPENALFYYVHSYKVVCHEEDMVIGKCEYGSIFCAAAAKENIIGTQFHPEKSQFYGLQLLKNFLELN